eukprot:CAMPEP_0115315992 /NCGR_PEP_ID=MMETSP0270-20121206/77879_1 /TAXON_ID=71861 /ORGANISM="Scrippsiella trochoidea, Strain CCMP3099" /LENGTH=111 /DNA_ID=CAMNT_0002735357 /DNA_START=277 /DNA_END=612 /DNA_ORIENTATION=+
MIPAARTKNSASIKENSLGSVSMMQMVPTHLRCLSINGTPVKKRLRGGPRTNTSSAHCGLVKMSSMMMGKSREMPCFAMLSMGTSCKSVPQRALIFKLSGPSMARKATGTL